LIDNTSGCEIGGSTLGGDVIFRIGLVGEGAVLVPALMFHGSRAVSARNL
jgi:hypothetical protein